MNATTTGTPGTALSPQAHQAGGALVRILSDETEIERYSRGELSRIEQRAIGNLVARFPRLNTETNVGALIWLSSFHAVKPSDVSQLFEYFLEGDIYLVFEYLVEAGERTIKGSAYLADNEASYGIILELLELLSLHREVTTQDQKIESPEALHTLVVNLGGLSAISSYHTIELLQEALDHPKE